MNKSLLNRFIIVGIVSGIIFSGVLSPKTINADYEKDLAQSPNLVQAPKVVKTIIVSATAYSSTPDQTDDTPYLTASNKMVRDGIVAINGLAFGTRLMVPELYGDKIFVVEDRMNKKYGNLKRIDFWHSTREAANNFGVKRNVKVEILES